MFEKVVPLVLSSPTLTPCQRLTFYVSIYCLPVPLASDFEYTTAMGLYVLSGVGLQSSIR
jgi:hypothetical protein